MTKQRIVLYIVTLLFICCASEQRLLKEVHQINTVIDIDGNQYPVIKIGAQWWMAEDLKVTHYRNGDMIVNISDEREWRKTRTGAYCNFDNDEKNAVSNGLLYNWFAATDIRGLAPEGWHVPTDEDWKALEIYLGMSRSQADDTYYRGSDEGGQLKQTGMIHSTQSGFRFCYDRPHLNPLLGKERKINVKTENHFGPSIHWDEPNTGATNESGFSAIPTGYRTYNGYFICKGITASYWTSTESNRSNAFHRYLSYDYSQINRNHYYKYGGFLVRCVRDSSQ